MFSIYNATVVAVMQVGVIVAGALASGLWRHFFNNGVAMPRAAGLLYNYGVVGLFIPLGWLLFALLVLRSSLISDEVKTLAFVLGIAMLIGLTVFVLYADVSPAFHIMWNTEETGDD